MPAAPNDGGTQIPDPCPQNGPGAVPELQDDCDPVCCAQDQYCNGNSAVSDFCTGATCGNGPVAINDNRDDAFIIRIPGDPGTDPACALDCPSGGYAYGLGFVLTTSTYYDITVGLPWQIILHTTTAYCPQASSTVATNGCAFSGAGPLVVYVVTTDPHAPARNVNFTPVTQDMCPDAGP